MGTVAEYVQTTDGGSYCFWATCFKMPKLPSDLSNLHEYPQWQP